MPSLVVGSGGRLENQRAFLYIAMPMRLTRVVEQGASTEPSPYRRRARKQGLFKAIALVLGLAVAVLIGEAGLRLFFPGYLSSGSQERELFCRFDREIGWVPLENVTAIHTGAGRPALVHQNQYGLRGPDDMSLTGSPPRRRVLVLGDSYVWGFGVGQDEIFSNPRVHGGNVEILNLGVSGYGTDQEYLLYLRTGTNFTVDKVVVALTPYNDIENNLEPEQYGYLKPVFKLQEGRLVLHTEHVRERKVYLVSAWLLQHSRVWNLLGEGIRRGWELLARRGDAKGAAKAKKTVLNEEDVTERDREGVELTIAILQRLRDAVVAHKAKFSVIFIPYRRHIHNLVPVNHPLVPLLAAGMARAGITYQEPYPEFLKAAQGGAHVFNSQDNHFGSEGHALFAKFLMGTDLARASENYYGRH
jgi:hypothetical protein